MKTQRVVRGGSIWRHRIGRNLVEVLSCQTINPMGSVRPHSNMRWKLVRFTQLEGPYAGVSFDTMHESDFRRRYVWVKGKKK